MKTSKSLPRAWRSTAVQRAQLLAAFDRSGLSAAAFARQHQLSYTTFCNWRQRRDRSARAPKFVEVQLPVTPVTPAQSSGGVLIVELDQGARLRLESPAQIALAAALLQALHAPRAC